jgi:hypothetical protein
MITLTNQNNSHKGIRCKLTLENACCHRVQNLLENVKGRNLLKYLHIDGRIISATTT